MTTNSSGAPAANPGGSKRLAQQQAQVDEVVDIMRQNVDKVLERDKNLSLLDDRADKLQHNAAQFEQHAGKLKRKYWWKNMKMMIIMGVVGVIFAIVVIGWIASKVKPEPSVLPPGGLTTAVPSAKEAGLPMTTPSVGRISTRRRAHIRKQKTTTPTPSKANTADGADDDDKESINPGEEETKAAIKRVIRALVNRQ